MADELQTWHANSNVQRAIVLGSSSVGDASILSDLDESKAGGGGQEQQMASPMLTAPMMIGAGRLHSIARGDEPQAFQRVASGPSVEKVVDPC